MTNQGTIKFYDSGKGTGTILPEKGGDALPFRKVDLQQQAQVPMADQLYSYDTKVIDNGKNFAVNLRQQGETNVKAEQASAQKG